LAVLRGASDTEQVSSETPETKAFDVFTDFVEFLKSTQNVIIEEIENMDGSGVKFSNDTWGVFKEANDEKVTSGGITRVLQGGNIVEKGACSLTLIQRGILSAERATAIRSRQDLDIKPGDEYYAAALSIVLHSRSPMVPTFRSDVRIFLVQGDKNEMAWFGGGADLTPYYLFDEDVTSFHRLYRDLCSVNPDEFSYEELKKRCDEYFYLPARAEHRGTGGIFFDDMAATEGNALEFVKNVASTWMPSWLPIVEKHRDRSFSEKQKQWQLLRRGR
jgi:coproporphyrinogen III oxidase